MKKLIICSLAVAMIALLSVNAIAKDKEEGKMHVKGTVSVTKDASGNITAVMLTTEKGEMYNITLDEKGKELGEKMEGKMVKVKGMEMMKDGQKWLTVEKFSERKKGKGY